MSWATTKPWLNQHQAREFGDRHSVVAIMIGGSYRYITTAPEFVMILENLIWHEWCLLDYCLPPDASSTLQLPIWEVRPTGLYSQQPCKGCASWPRYSRYYRCFQRASKVKIVMPVPTCAVRQACKSTMIRLEQWASQQAIPLVSNNRITRADYGPVWWLQLHNFMAETCSALTPSIGPRTGRKQSFILGRKPPLVLVPHPGVSIRD